MAYDESDRLILLAFGERVRAARQRHGWSQEQFAAKAGMDRTYVGAIERGERNPALLNINKLADTLGDNFADFFPQPTESKSKTPSS